MFGISRFGINKLWLGLMSLMTVTFLILSTLYSLEHSTYLKKRCFDFINSETHPNFGSCYNRLNSNHYISLFIVAGIVGLIVLRILFRVKDWKKLLNLSININSVYRKKLVFMVFLIGIIIKRVAWAVFCSWVFFQISTGYNQNVLTNEGFYTSEVRHTTLQWFNYSSFALGVIFFYILLRIFNLFGKSIILY